MTTSTDFDRQLLAFLEAAGPTGPADEVLDAAFVEARTLRQRRAPWPVGPRTWPGANRSSLVAVAGVAIATVALLVASLALVAGSPVQPVTESVNPAVLPPSSAQPATPRPTVARVTVVPDALEGTWSAPRPDNISVGGPSGPGTLVLQVSGGGMRIRSLEADATILSGLELRQVTDGELVVDSVAGVATTVYRDGAALDGCTPLLAGRYTWRIGAPEPGDESGVSAPLELAVVDDPCPSRAALLAGTWHRSAWSAREGGPSLIEVAGVGLHVDLPDAPYTPAGNGSGWLLSSADGSTAFGVWADPRILLDPCDELGGTTDAATNPESFLAAIARNPAFHVARTELALLGPTGVQATRVVLEPGSNAPACVSDGGGAALALQTGQSWSLPTASDLYLLMGPPTPSGFAHLLVIAVRMPTEAQRDRVLRSIEIVQQSE